jgi:hypothetical protein
MSPLIWIGLGIGVFVDCVYIGIALKKKASPTLESCIHIFLTALGLMGAVRILGFVVCGSFSALVKADLNQGIFALTEEDSVTFIIAAVALGWVTAKLFAKPFKEL